MTIKLACPYCRFTKELPESAIPPAAKRAVCPQCGQQFLFTRDEAASEESITSAPGAGGPAYSPSPDPTPAAAQPVAAPAGEAAAPAAIPWETRSESGFWTAFFNTLKQVVSTPRAFFQASAHSGGIREPMAFGFLTGTLGSMAAFFWQSILVLAGITSFGEMFPRQLSLTSIIVTLFLVLPLVVLGGMFLFSGLLHIFLRVTGVGRRRLSSTFRVVAYSQAAQLAAFLPFVGGWVAGVWQLILQIIGLRTIHAASYGRIILAFLIPVIVGIVIAATVVILIPFMLLRAI